jgi:hypothetical protein
MPLDQNCWSNDIYVLDIHLDTQKFERKVLMVSYLNMGFPCCNM